MLTRLFKPEGLCVVSLSAVFRPISVKTALVLCRCSAASSTFHADLASQAGQAPTELTQILPSQQIFLSISCSQLGVPLDFCDTTKQVRSLNYRQVGSSTNRIRDPSLHPNRLSTRQQAASPAKSAKGSTLNLESLRHSRPTLDAFCVLRLPSVFSPPRPSPTDPAASDRLSSLQPGRIPFVARPLLGPPIKPIHLSLGFFWLAATVSNQDKKHQSGPTATR